MTIDRLRCWLGFHDDRPQIFASDIEGWSRGDRCRRDDCCLARTPRQKERTKVIWGVIGRLSSACVTGVVAIELYRLVHA